MGRYLNKFMKNSELHVYFVYYYLISFIVNRMVSVVSWSQPVYGAESGGVARGQYFSSRSVFKALRGGTPSRDNRRKLWEAKGGHPSAQVRACRGGAGGRLSPSVAFRTVHTCPNNVAV